MSRIITLLLLVCLNAGLSHGTVCSFGNKNIISKMIDSCPGLLDSADKSYCCMDFESKEMYCCNSTEFALKSTWSLLVVIAIIATVLSLILFCVSCLCCSCCPWYRRRHRGTVYGIFVPEVETPSTIHVIQTTANVPQPVPQYTNVAYPANSRGMPQPPTFAEVMYEKQAPYNPNYVSSNYK
ncbi:hypothetical protein ANTQUA_LOCUS933 [Anthophora quadrimaculata]